MQDLYLQATLDLGVREQPGAADSPEIMEYFRLAGHSWVNSELTPWCSAAMCAWAIRAGYQMTGSLRARSWLDVPCEERIDSISDLRVGDVVILWRGKPDGPQGHVGCFGSARGGMLNLLGGNQSNRVWPKAYPDYRFLGGRRLLRA